MAGSAFYEELAALERDGAAFVLVLLAEAVGKPVPISHECALATRDQVAGGMNGWFQYQPMWNMISRQEPDLFD